MLTAWRGQWLPQIRQWSWDLVCRFAVLERSWCSVVDAEGRALQHHEERPAPCSWQGGYLSGAGCTQV